MAIGEEFYFYHYPFFFPDSFLIYKNKYDLEIKLQLIESFSQGKLEKGSPRKIFESISYGLTSSNTPIGTIAL